MSLALPPGRRLGRYEIRSVLGAGGMGEVYLAHDTTLQRPAAIKLLPGDVSAHPERLARFQREALAVSSLNHPNILTIYEIGSEEGLHFIAAEFIEGESLRERIRRGNVAVRETLDIAIQIASALSAAHAAGIIHRDIKPDNIMLRRDGIVKVVDFGVAKLIAPEEASAGTQDSTVAFDQTAPGVVMGTVRYMSPEQARGTDVDARSDIFSLGTVIYETIAGHSAFEGDTRSDLIAEILKTEPAGITTAAPDAPAELERILTKALRKDRDERYQSAKDLTLDLKALKQHLEFAAHAGSSGLQHAAVSSGPASVGHEVRRHKRAAAMIIVALLLVAVALAGIFYFGQRSAGINSLAVLPFVNAAHDPNTEYLSDGLSESLIDRLSLLPQLKIIARSSTFRYKGKDTDPLEIARALGVRAVMTGRVMQRGDDLLISAELVDARDGTHIWGDHFDVKAAGLQGVQEQIAASIAQRLRLSLTGAQQQQLKKRATQNPDAYQLYLTGVFYVRRGGKENFRKALDYFNQAIALDPNFALAYAGASNMDSALSIGSPDPRAELAKAKNAAQKALQIDPDLAEAHSALGILERADWDWSGAESEFKRAIELNPSYAQAHGSYAVYLSRVGRSAEALSEIQRAKELDPLSIAIKSSEASILLWARRYDEAMEHFREVLKMQPDYALAYEYLGYAYAAKHMYPEAIAEYGKFTGMNKGSTASVECYLGYAYAMSGKRVEALATLKKMTGMQGAVSAAELAILYTGLGDKEGALAALERAYAAHDPQMQYLKVEPSYDTLRGDRRFQDLLRRIGLN